MTDFSTNPRQPELDELCINAIRFMSVDVVENAGSGHPGMPMGAAAMAYVLWTRFLRFNPSNPSWPDRDRFVLSAGHGSALLYSLLHLFGYDLSLDELKNFRQWGSRTPGHPERELIPGVEVTTGPLGQGFANAVGLAIAERHLASRFNRPHFAIVNHWTYVIAGDGDMMEGITSEAASLAGHLRLGRLTCLYDSNYISLSGATQLTFTEDVGRRFEAYGWQVQHVEDGNDIEALGAAIRSAIDEETRPSLIVVRTHIGFGSPQKQDTFEAHGSPLGREEIAAAKQNLGWPTEPEFYVPAEALAYFRGAVARGAALESAWKALLASYGTQHPELFEEWQLFMQGRLPEGWDRDVPVFTPGQKALATRSAGHDVLNGIARRVSNLIGGSADLDPSTLTVLEDEGSFQPPGSGDDKVQGSPKGVWTYAARNISFGVREHAMGGILNGIAAHGGLIPFGSTFLVFADYLRPSVRLAALAELNVIYVFTHDSVIVGEDGPTHQPVEQLASLRVIPNLTVIRPADANETAVAWRLALESADGPVALVLTRQKLPIIDRRELGSADGLRKGAYILADSPGKPQVILIATGSEVHPALEAWKQLSNEGCQARVVSMPSWELFEEQPEAYRNEVLPPGTAARVTVEAASAFGWHKYAGSQGRIMSIDRFGASAPGEVNRAKFGFSTEHVVAAAKETLRHMGTRGSNERNSCS